MSDISNIQDFQSYATDHRVTFDSFSHLPPRIRVIVTPHRSTISRNPTSTEDHHCAVPIDSSHATHQRDCVVWRDGEYSTVGHDSVAASTYKRQDRMHDRRKFVHVHIAFYNSIFRRSPPTSPACSLWPDFTGVIRSLWRYVPFPDRSLANSRRA